MGTFPPTGVNAATRAQRARRARRRRLSHVKIVVSGGFNADEIREFERDARAGRRLCRRQRVLRRRRPFDFTADIVAIDNGDGWRECHKVGRPERPNPRLTAGGLTGDTRQQSAFETILHRCRRY